MYAWGKSKSVSFSRVYVFVKAKLTLVSFLYFFYAPSPKCINISYFSKFVVLCKLFARNFVVFWENLHSWHKIYTTAGHDGLDKSQFCHLDQ